MNREKNQQEIKKEVEFCLSSPSGQDKMRVRRRRVLAQLLVVRLEFPARKWRSPSFFLQVVVRKKRRKNQG